MNTQLQQQGDHFFLNLRFILIVTVIIGNAIEPLITRMEAVHTLYMWIFSFHMPLFVLVTGYFAKSSMQGDAGKKTLAQIGIQYLIFQTLYSTLDVMYFQVDNIHHSFFAPYLLLWFLVSHICWRLLFMSLKGLRPVFQLVIAVSLGVLAGYLPVEGVWLSISRTFVFFPFFVAGCHFSYDSFLKKFTPALKKAAASTSLLLLAAFGLWGEYLQPGWLYGNMTYTQLDANVWYAGLFRIAIYMLEVTAAVSFLVWIPTRVCRMTDLGRRTLYVFLLHGLLIRWASMTVLYDSIQGIGGAAVLIVFSILTAVLLAQPQLRRVCRPFIEPSVDSLLKLENIASRRFFARKV